MRTATTHRLLRQRTLRGVALIALGGFLASIVTAQAIAAQTTKPSAAAQTTKPSATAKHSTATTSSSASSSATKSSSTAKKTPARSAAPSLSATTSTTGESLVAAPGNVVLRDEPEGHALATLSAGVPMTVVARDHGWVRVHVDGWVREDSVQVSNGTTTGSLSAADLRVDPQGAKGKTVRWDVQVLALETADFLHKDLSPDEPYLLARGPGSDNTLIYVAVPPSMLASAKTLAATAPVSATLVATVRVGRSEPVGVPILDAQSIARR